jgi:hypothetical protein
MSSPRLVEPDNVMALTFSSTKQAEQEHEANRKLPF